MFEVFHFLFKLWKIEDYGPVPAMNVMLDSFLNPINCQLHEHWIFVAVHRILLLEFF